MVKTASVASPRPAIFMTKNRIIKFLLRIEAQNLPRVKQFTRVCHLEWSRPQPQTWSPISGVSPQNYGFPDSHLSSQFWATLLRLLSPPPDCASGSLPVTLTVCDKVDKLGTARCR